MPADNVWLVQRQAERGALVKLLAAMQASPGRAVQGAGSPSSPVPVSIDLTRQAAPPPPPNPGDENNILLALTAEVTRLKKRLRDQEKELRQALAQAHGENLELRRELARRGGPTPHARTGITGPC